MTKIQAVDNLRHLVILDDKINNRKHNIHVPRIHDIDVHDPLNSM